MTLTQNVQTESGVMVMNDAEWFYNIYEQYSKNLYRYLHTLLKGRGRPEAVPEIEDCIQETFIVLWNKRETLQAHPKLDAWLYKTSSNIPSSTLPTPLPLGRGEAMRIPMVYSGRPFRNTLISGSFPIQRFKLLSTK